MLPPAAALLPYLGRIDEARLYSNYGPLVRELEARLAARLGLPQAGVTTVANATLGLSAALAMQAAPRGTLCAMPAWTFVASPLAALAVGLEPYFLDVDAVDWALHPTAVEAAIAALPGRVGAVMPVAPFGRPIDVAAWDAFAARTGIAVAIDAAAGFDAIRPGRVPSVVSLHATKALGCGEGGFVASQDAALIRRIQTWCAFGFHGSRDAQVAGGNAKLSEYHAAVALAGLDRWVATRAALAERALAYGAAFGSTDAVRLQPGFGADWVANTCVVELPAGAAPAVATGLDTLGIDHRHWWGAGAHRHTATAGLGRARLPVTERLATATIGLPFYADLPQEHVAIVARATLAALPA